MLLLNSIMPERRFFLPNLITVGNLFMGFTSIIMSLQGEVTKACWLILFAIILDGLDGRAARRLNGFSNFGKELDSFADAVSFGVATGILIYTILASQLYLAIFVSFTFMLCGILRLVRFNLETISSGEKEDFKGLPIPAAAGLIASYIIFIKAVNAGPDVNLLVTMALLASFLMLTNAKNMSLDRFMQKPMYVIPVAITLVVWAKYTLFPVFVLYSLLGIVGFAIEVGRVGHARLKVRV